VQKILAGAELFEHACEVPCAGIRLENPGVAEAKVQALLRDRLALARRLGSWPWRAVRFRSWQWTPTVLGWGILDTTYMPIHLSKEHEQFVHNAVLTGRYASEDDVIRDALSRLKQDMPKGT
jgi:hypothetical protein